MSNDNSSSMFVPSSVEIAAYGRDPSGKIKVSRNIFNQLMESPEKVQLFLEVYQQARSSYEKLKDEGLQEAARSAWNKEMRKAAKGTCFAGGGGFKALLEELESFENRKQLTNHKENSKMSNSDIDSMFVSSSVEIAAYGRDGKKRIKVSDTVFNQLKESPEKVQLFMEIYQQARSSYEKLKEEGLQKSALSTWNKEMRKAAKGTCFEIVNFLSLLEESEME